MNPSLKRQIIPMTSWSEFLTEGKEEFSKLYELKSSQEYKKDDFQMLRTLGMGAFGRVFLARMIKTDKYYAVKVLEKSRVVKSKQVKHALNEKRILQALNHPFSVHLEYSYQDNSYLYMALPFVSGGEMFSHLRKMKKFEEVLSQFYTAQVLLAFEYLHYCSMIFRDLKPENLLVDERGYVKLTDFGFCKIVKDRTYTMCGTPEYLAPEIILSKGYGKAVDWWSFGVLLFELNAGYPPFHAKDPMKIYEKAVSVRYSIPKFFSDELEDIIRNLLQSDISKRYGNLKSGISDIKDHKWYKSINWIALFNQKLEAPYKPVVLAEDDTTNFDRYKETPLQVAAKDIFGNLFEDF